MDYCKVWVLLEVYKPLSNPFNDTNPLTPIQAVPSNWICIKMAQEKLLIAACLKNEINLASVQTSWYRWLEWFKNVEKKDCRPKRWRSKLLFGMYSYTSIFSSLSEQNPRSLTRFMCCSLAVSETSFLNSSSPWVDDSDSLLTAISRPLGKFP